MMRVSLAILLALTGCTHPNQAPITDTDTDVDTDTDTDIEPTDAFEGQIVYEDGTAAEGHVRIELLDLNVDRVALPDAEGVFRFSVVPPGPYSFSVTPIAASEVIGTYATPFDIVVFDEATDAIVLDSPVVVYRFANRGALSDDRFDAGRGLIIDVDAADITLPFSAPEADEVTSVSVDPADSGLLLQGIAGDIFGMWYLGPFASEVGWTFQVEDTGLDEGTVLRVFNTAYGAIAWEELGTLTVNADGDARGVAEIKYLTTLVLVVE